MQSIFLDYSLLYLGIIRKCLVEKRKENGYGENCWIKSTSVCPTEITGYSRRYEDFTKAGADILAVSVDSEHSHKAWMNMDPSKGGLGPVKFPIAADLTKSVSKAYGVLVEEDGIALRGLFIIDPEGIIRYAVVHDLNVGRSVDETLRVLYALQSGGLCPLDWQMGEKTLVG